jgi:AcrR family transcriptional regulator
MGRRPEIQDADILQAARHVFLSRGVHATALEVARRANISEASVFKRFKTKGALFCAAMRPSLELPTCLARLPDRAGQRALATNLEEAGRAVLEVMRVVLPTMMMAWSNRIDGPPQLEGHASQKETLQPLVTYCKREMELGRLRAGDPEVFARAFVGGIADDVVTETLRHGVYPTALTPHKYLRGLIDLLLNGAAASAGRARETTRNPTTRPARRQPTTRPARRQPKG